jgi:hypothetical protein
MSANDRDFGRSSGGSAGRTEEGGDAGTKGTGSAGRAADEGGDAGTKGTGSAGRIPGGDSGKAGGSAG